MSNTKYVFLNGSLTDVGLVRQLNEDCELILNINSEANAFIVCDGMGGHDSGDKASKAAVRFISEYLKNRPIQNATIALMSAIKFANEQIFIESEMSPTSKGMGTTAVVMLQFQDEILVGHVGDSRAYRLHNDKLVQITKDHSVVQDMVDQGLINQHQAENHPRKNEITKALGIRRTEEPTISNNIRAVKGDRFILCTDGLSGLISHDAFTNAVKTYKDPNVCAMKLIQMAKNGGGHDNITVQVIDVLESPNHSTNNSSNRNQTILLASAAAFIGILTITIASFYMSDLIDIIKETAGINVKVRNGGKTVEDKGKTLQKGEVTKDSLLKLTPLSKHQKLYDELIAKNEIQELIDNNLINSYNKTTLTYKLHKDFIKTIERAKASKDDPKDHDIDSDVNIGNISQKGKIKLKIKGKGKDKGKLPSKEKEADKEAEKDGSKETEKATSKGIERDNTKDSGKGAGKGPDKDSGKETGKDTGKGAGKETGKGPDKDSGKETGKDTGKGAGKETEKGTDKDSGKETGKDSGKGAGKGPDKDASKDLGKGAGKDANKSSLKGTIKGGDKLKEKLKESEKEKEKQKAKSK